MKQTSTRKIKSLFARKRANALIIFAIILGLTGYYAYNYSWFSPKNYAADVASPIEKQLKEAGAISQKVGGDGGFGFTNKEPWYDAEYRIGMSTEDTIELVTRVSKNNGYNLQHATPENRGPLRAVADEYISEWYFATTKANHFKDLQEGDIELSFQIRKNESTSDLRIHVELPRFR